MRLPYIAWLTANLAATAAFTQATAQTPAQLDPRFLAGLEWRNVGPFRGGRISAVSGAIGQPGVFYAGNPAGGVSKTTNAGATWFPIFDSVTNVSSIGSIEVAPSDPNVIYAGTGDMRTAELNEGNGMYKSTDAGRTWQHIGLASAHRIPSILVDPRDAGTVLAATRGDGYARMEQRGVFRTTDGGATWTKTLYVDEVTSADKLARAYDMPDIIYASTRYAFQPPGAGNVVPLPRDSVRMRTRLYKSTDGGVSWRELSGNGLPPRIAGRVSIAVAMHTNGQRVYLIGNFGFFRSDDGGATWRRMAESDPRIINGQGGFNCGVYVDPSNPDVVYTFNISAYKSTDGGNTFTGFRGFMGDDPQQMWIDPTDGKRMIMGYDQGAIVSLDAGATWSSWYNQSNEQLYHISTDNSFPYWIYGTQQDAGAIATRSRGNLGAVSMLDWKPVPGWEWGTVVADPRDPGRLFAGGVGVIKITYPAEEWINVSPVADPPQELRSGINWPLVWNKWQGRNELLVGYQYVMATTDDGMHWTKLSPDLTVHRRFGPRPAGAQRARTDTTPAPPPTGTIESIAVSPLNPAVIWAGTMNGIVHVTRDHGAIWTEASVPDIEQGPRPIYVLVSASPHDVGTAYASLDGQFRGDFAPHVYRTRDFGKTWTKIVRGLPDSQPNGSYVHVVRADPKRRGLLFAGTGSGLHVSFDDGDHWQSFMSNLPNTTYNDIAIHGNDLIVATYGRGIWILDDYSPLRELQPSISAEPARLFKPGDAVRARHNVNTDTPIPPDMPQGANPPPGAIIYYSLGAKPAGEVTIDVLDSSGIAVRHLSSIAAAPAREVAKPPMPSWWLAPPYALPTNLGLNRTNWDLRYDAPAVFAHIFELNGNAGATPLSPLAPLVTPGVYTVRLTSDGRRYTRTVTVRPDPRSRASAAQLAAQHALQMKLYSALRATKEGVAPVAALRARITPLASGDSTSGVVKAARALVARLDSIVGDTAAAGRYAWDAPPDAWNLATLNGEFALQLGAQANADHPPTDAMRASYRTACSNLRTLGERWTQVVARDVPALNRLLSEHGVAPLAASDSKGLGRCVP